MTGSPSRCRPAHIFQPTSACLRFFSYSASIASDSWRTILAWTRYHQHEHPFAASSEQQQQNQKQENESRTVRKSFESEPGDDALPNPESGLTFSIANSSSALTWISRAFSLASWEMNATCKDPG